MWPKVLYDISEHTALGERMLLPERQARKALASLRKDLEWKVFLEDLPKLYHVLGPIYADGRKRYRVKRLKYPYDPGTYTYEEL